MISCKMDPLSPISGPKASLPWRSSILTRQGGPVPAKQESLLFILQPGTYFIGFGVFTTGPQISARITATVTGGSAPPPVIPPSANLAGIWNWSAACTSGPFTGQFQLNQSGNALSGQFLGSVHVGTIAGTIQGTQVAFNRTFGTRTQQWTATVQTSIGGQLTLQGNVTETNPNEQCTFTAQLQSGGTTPLFPAT